MGADNHPTVVPADARATARNPYKDYDNSELMREFARTDARLARGAGGAHLKAAKFALARELNARDISARAARERFAYPRE